MNGVRYGVPGAGHVVWDVEGPIAAEYRANVQQNPYSIDDHGSLTQPFIQWRFVVIMSARNDKSNVVTVWKRSREISTIVLTSDEELPSLSPIAG